MAHFAQVNEDGIVVDIMKINDDHENDGQDYINNVCMIPGRWIKTSYNTLGNIHKYGGTPFRGNYATIGGTYDEERDVFLNRKLYPSMILNEENYQWEFPVPLPDKIVLPAEKILTDIPGRIIVKGCDYIWDETVINWRLECFERIVDLVLD